MITGNRDDIKVIEYVDAMRERQGTEIIGVCE